TRRPSRRGRARARCDSLRSERRTSPTARPRTSHSSDSRARDQRESSRAPPRIPCSARHGARLPIVPQSAHCPPRKPREEQRRDSASRSPSFRQRITASGKTVSEDFPTVLTSTAGKSSETNFPLGRPHHFESVREVVGAHGAVVGGVA